MNENRVFVMESERVREGRRGDGASGGGQSGKGRLLVGEKGSQKNGKSSRVKKDARMREVEARARAPSRREKGGLS